MSVTWLNAKVAFASFIHLSAVSIRIDFRVFPRQTGACIVAEAERSFLLSHILHSGLINFYFISVVNGLDKVVCSVRSIAWRTPTTPHSHSFIRRRQKRRHLLLIWHSRETRRRFQATKSISLSSHPFPNTYAPICLAAYVFPINALFSASIGCVFGSVAV